MTVNRELTPQEQIFEASNRLNGSSNILVISQIKGCIIEKLLRKAIALVQQRHPLLNTRIVGALDSLRFDSEGTQQIPLRVIDNYQEQQIDNYQEQKWQNIALEELNQELESSKALARVVLVRNQGQNTSNYLFITIHHGIADGLSSFQLQSQILDYYHKLESEQRINPVTSLPKIPPLQELVAASIRKSMENHKSSGKLQELKPIEFETLGFEKIIPRELRSCGMLHRQLNQESTQRLLTTCRQEKTTIQGALCAAMLFTAAKKISAGNKKEIHLSCLSSVSLRKFIQPIISNECLGLIASNLIVFHKITRNKLFWDLAREVIKEIENSIDCGEIFRVVFSMTIDGMMSNHNQALATVAVTNLGQINIPKRYGSLELEEIHFAAGAATFGDQLFCAVTTFEGRMFLNFPFSQPSLSQQTMEILVDDALSYLTDASLGKTIILEV